VYEVTMHFPIGHRRWSLSVAEEAVGDELRIDAPSATADVLMRAASCCITSDRNRRSNPERKDGAAHTLGKVSLPRRVVKDGVGSQMIMADVLVGRSASRIACKMGLRGARDQYRDAAWFLKQIGIGSRDRSWARGCPATMRRKPGSSVSARSRWRGQSRLGAAMVLPFTGAGGWLRSISCSLSGSNV